MINYLEQQLKFHAASEDSDKDQRDLDPQIYCTLGHLNLLLENYPKGIMINLLATAAFNCQ
jgi:hypothetical protein